MSQNNKIKIGSGYIYYKVVGDGHCYANCYLEFGSKSYKNADTISSNSLKPTKSNIARKFRLDFANFLLSESGISKEKIHSRLNFKSPTFMAKYFYIDGELDEEGYFRGVGVELANLCDMYDGSNEETLYEIISEYFLLRDKSQISFKAVKDLYETDIREHIMRLEPERSTQDVGIGLYSPTINYYAICNGISGDQDEIKLVIENLINGDSFLEFNTSILIAQYFDLNVTCLQLGSGYSKPLEISETKPGRPCMIMVNYNNIHWDLIAHDNGNDLNILLMNVDDVIKTGLLKVLNKLYNDGKIGKIRGF